MACLEIKSEPPGASVFIKGARYGATPLSLRFPPADSLRILVVKQYFEIWTGTVHLLPRDTARISIVLRRIETALRIIVEDTSADAYVDGLLAGRGSVPKYRVDPGVHEIRIADSSTGRSVSNKFLIGEGETAAFRAQLGFRSVKRLAGSIFLPGSAQFSDGEYLEAGAALGLTAGAVAFMLGSIRTYDNRVSAYQQAVNAYGAAQTEADAIARRQIAIQRQDDLNPAYRVRTASYVLLGAVLALNLLDTILNHMVTDEIRFVPAGDLRFLSPVSSTSPVRVNLAVQLP